MAKQILQGLDHPLDRHPIGDQLDGVLRLAERRHLPGGVLMIPLGDLGLQSTQRRNGEAPLLQVLGPPSGPLSHAGGEKHLAIRLGEHGRADVPAFRHQTPPTPHGLLLGRQRLADTAVGRHQRHLSRDLRTANGHRDIVTIDGDLGIVVVPGTEPQIEPLQQGSHRGGIAGIHPLLLHPPGERPIHRSGVEVHQPQPTGQGTGHRALAGTSRAIDGDDRGTAHQKYVVDQSAGTAVDRRRQERQPCHPRQWLQVMCLHQLQVVETQASGPQLALRHGQELRRLAHTTGMGRSRGREGRRQGQGLPLLIKREVTVAGTAGQAPLRPHRGAALNQHGPAQIGDHPPQNHQLLPILLAHHQPIGTHQTKQATDHRGHPIKMARSGATTEPGLQRWRWLHPGEISLPMGIDLLQRRGE